METITVPGAFDGWVTLLEKHGTMKLADLLAPAIGYAENGFPVMEKIAADWAPEVRKAQDERRGARPPTWSTAARRSPGTIFVQKNLARTLRTLAKGGRDAFYRGEIAQGHRRLLPEERRLPLHGRFRRAEVQLGRADLDDLSRPHAVRAPPNNQGLTALLLLNILEGFDLKSMRTDPASTTTR